MNVEIRLFEDKDAEAASVLISRNLMEVVAKAYSREAMDRMIPQFTPDRLIQCAKEREFFVAQLGRDVVGTCTYVKDMRSAEEDFVCLTVFVVPELQHQGIGGKL